jgi:phosphoribosylaminoimidazolecarboxamide formyltransferase/IMP cyclohydrolase
VQKKALLSVYDKNGILDLGKALAENGWELLSTGGTARYLRENGLSVTDVSQITGFPECLDGRVKTLHPAIHAGLLARRGDVSHIETLNKLNIAAIDLVCVNLYPFFEKVQAGLEQDETVGFIDIGGPAMLRSAAKNFRDVIVLTDPADYKEVTSALRAGAVTIAERRRLAGKAFNLTSAYDAAVSTYLLDTESTESPYWTRSWKMAQSLRYGENGHQKAALYKRADAAGALSAMEQLGGKELGYNNIRDLDLAWKAACSFGYFNAGGASDPPALTDVRRIFGDDHNGACRAICCVAVKHNTPCGIATGSCVEEAFDKAYACDPVSIFGGIAAFNSPVDEKTAAKLAGLFLEIVVAPGFSAKALVLLRGKKNLRIMRAPLPPQDTVESTSVDGSLLVQDVNMRLFEKWDVVTKKQPDSCDIDDMLFGLGAVRWVRSNAIVVVKDGAAVGIGGGETNRIWAAEKALQRAAKAGARVLASDAFFPFPDVVEAAAKAGIKAIIQPGGSLKDAESIEACDALGMAMVFTGVRHFKH